ncbi:MAG: HNH endonuclease [Polaromonas sp.]|nr:HNH endonuclease [Polaromonas sp.]
MADANSTCVQCGKSFSFKIGRGTTRTLCSDKCAKDRRKESIASKPHKACSVDGCNAQATRSKDTICEAHYMRLRRHGSFDALTNVIDGPVVQVGGGYLLDYLPSHPLRVGSSPRVYQHRAVFYDAFGDGPFECHCCGKSVTWSDLHIDHLNDVVTDNRLSNLAPACPVCNQKRGRHKMVEATRKAGVILTAHGLSMCRSEWARHLGLTPAAISARIKNGWSLERALTPK